MALFSWLWNTFKIPGVYSGADKSVERELEAVKAQEAAFGLTDFVEEMFRNSVRLKFYSQDGELIGFGNGNRLNDSEPFTVTICKAVKGASEDDLINSPHVETLHRRELTVMENLTGRDLIWRLS